MGGTSKQESKSTSQLTPYEPATGIIDQSIAGIGSQAANAPLTSTETGALDTLKANAQAGNPYSSLIGNLATNMLKGGGAQQYDPAISENLASYKSVIDPVANGSVSGIDALKPQLDTLLSDTMNSYGGQFAAAGRDITGNAAGPQAIARGFAQGAAPIVANQVNTDLDRRLAAASSGFNAGNTTNSQLVQNQQTANQNATTGVNVGQAALDSNNWAANSLLAEEAQRRGIPLGNWQSILSSIAPVAQAFGQQNGSQSGTSTMSGAQQFASIMGGIGSIMPKAPITFAMG